MPDLYRKQRADWLDKSSAAIGTIFHTGPAIGSTVPETQGNLHV